MQNALHEHLVHKLFDYICDNNPDLLMQLEEGRALTSYLKGKVESISQLLDQYKNDPPYLLEERCMTMLTKDLRPSKYNYICRVLEEEFGTTYRQLKESGILKYEAINLVGYCNEVFESVHFSEQNEESRLLYYGIAGAISEYFDRTISEKENRGSWVTTANKS